MPRVSAPDGAGLHWEERGSGPTVLLTPHWSFHPVLFEPLARELERDHRVVRFDDRGTGESDRIGPYDLDTGADDLEAVVEDVGGGPLVAVGLMDGVNKAIRVAARRPDLVAHVVGSGGAPLARHAFEGHDSMIASNTVVGAFMQQLETDYRGATRALVEAANPNMSMDDVRARVGAQVEYVPVEAALARVREWAEDEAVEAPARELGSRLCVLLSTGTAAGWWPEPEVMAPLMREHFPEAAVEILDDGIISRPDLAARAVRERTRAGVESAP